MLSIRLDDRPPILDASPQARKEATFAALIAHLQSLARMRPLLVVLEDAHWADASSIELFNAVMPALTDVPALVIISTRDGDPRVLLGRVRTLALSRLDRRQSAALATSIIADAKLAPELIDRIVDQTDGIPLFVEELTKTVVETASADSAGRVPLAVPASLQASLMARLDRIPVAKEVAQVGAVFGREFAHALLATVAALPEQTLLRGLQQLIDAGLAAREGTPPNARYTFKHALDRDTAYGMLLRSRRRELHASAATVLDDDSPELRERQPELLAHHYAQAGMIEPAISYWAKAGRRSVARSAMVEAVAQVHQALELVPELPEGAARLRQELELQGLLGGALFALQAWSDGSAMRAFARAQELAEQLEDVEATARFLAGQVTYHIGQCQYREARDVAVKLLRISENSDTPIVQLIAHRCMAVCLHWTGQFTDALAHFDRVLDLYDPARDRQLAGILGFDVYVQAAFLACWDLLILGRPEQAATRFELARTQLRDIEHKHSHAFALGYGGVWSLFMGDQDSAFRQLTETLELATEQRFAAWVGTADLLLGSVFTAAADGARGLAQAREGYARYAAAAGISHADTGLVLNATFYLALLAHACEAAGMPAEAREHLDTALDVAARSGECWFEPELHRLKAEWLLRNAPGEEAQAEATFIHAIDHAFRQNALFWELRASVSLARLHVALGRPERARELLNRVCEKFSDKRALPELREAETLLAGLFTQRSPRKLSTAAITTITPINQKT
jgi:predicted ATPase